MSFSTQPLKRKRTAHDANVSSQSSSMCDSSPKKPRTRQEVMFETMDRLISGGDYNTAKVLLDTRRTKDGRSYGPRWLSVNKELLTVQSKELQKFFDGDLVLEDDGYHEDSDLEEDEDESSSGSQPKVEEETQVVKFGAYKTWKALVFSLYQDNPSSFIEYKALDPRTRPEPDDEVSISLGPSQVHGSRVVCSPKSLYRLAVKFHLSNICFSACTGIKERLTPQNIVDQLFGDFTWRYPKVIVMQTQLLSEWRAKHDVKVALEKLYPELAKGKYPNSAAMMRVPTNNDFPAPPRNAGPLTDSDWDQEPVVVRRRLFPRW
ncbi:hypothetical protein BXZ70DRAFT_1034860 [Cristinia sonorae]|uniref:Uncharacterized protein n=1 Tax=Cristinia sonorae TaxID=1940300 RepID=A0A8K0UJV2_9AGAR|nr:hypothetical protein BXZ70DRAFT_1034860 [Cristinia sonorae]